MTVSPAPGGEPAAIAVDFENVGPPLGTRFPDLALPDQSGDLVDLHEHRDGRRALIVFHRSAGW